MMLAVLTIRGFELFNDKLPFEAKFLFTLSIIDCLISFLDTYENTLSVRGLNANTSSL